MMNTWQMIGQMMDILHSMKYRALTLERKKAEGHKTNIQQKYLLKRIASLREWLDLLEEEIRGNNVNQH